MCIRDRGTPGAKPTQGLTPRAKHVIECAAEEAVRGGFSYVGTEHLLVGLLRDGRNMGVRILRAAGQMCIRDRYYMLSVFCRARYRAPSSPLT